MWMPLAKYSKAPCTNRSHNLSIPIPSFTACSSVYCSQRETKPNNFTLVRKEQNGKIQIPNSIRFLVRTLSESRPFRFAIPKVFVGKQGRLGSSAQTSGESNESNKLNKHMLRTKDRAATSDECWLNSVWLDFSPLPGSPIRRVPRLFQEPSALVGSLEHQHIKVRRVVWDAWFFTRQMRQRGEANKFWASLMSALPEAFEERCQFHLRSFILIPFANLHEPPKVAKPRERQSQTFSSQQSNIKNVYRNVWLNHFNDAQAQIQGCRNGLAT